MQNNLFSRKNLEDTLHNYKIPEIEKKIEILEKWVREIKNGGIFGKSESECEQAFNQDIFQNVLGYTKYPELQYTIEPKGSTVLTAQKADAILGYFSAKQLEENAKHVQAVVEIKDANTSLDAPQKREGHLSPVQQGFKYKPQYEKCVWVIVTNFKEIRLYKDNQISGQLRYLTDLVNPENDYLNLKFFYYILNAKNFLAVPGEKESKTLKALSEVKIYQKEISNKFYKEYKEIRLGLINDIHNNNPEKSIDFVIGKAQKIIDRIIFIHFCEDLGLLPEGGLENQLKAVKNIAGLTKWDALIGFFKAVDKGSEQLHIPQGYNGGLFKVDSELDSLVIGDKICSDLVLLGDYDFAEDLSVNILGHIFEQSVSDLEKIKINLLGTDIETSDLGEAKGVSKRKKDGIFYTPEYIVDYIVRNSLGKYLEEKYKEIEKEALKGLKKDAGEKTIQQRDNKIYTGYKQVLENIKVCDPACGSGAFLVKVFDYLLSEHQRVANLLQQDSLFDQNEIYKDILQKNIYGVDLNPESVEITKLSLWLKTANKGKKLTNLDANIKCGNSLIDDPEVAGEKAFNWQEQFPEVFENGGFDVVVGNPPYVLCQPSNTEEKVLEYYKTYEVASYKIDLFHLFFEKGINVCKNLGYLGYITPNTYLMNKYMVPLRKFLLENGAIRYIVSHNNSVFMDASVDVATTIIQKNGVSKNIEILTTNQDNENFNYISEKKQEMRENDSDYIFNIRLDNLSFFNRVHSINLGDVAISYFGIQAYNRKESISFEKLNDNYLEIIDGEDIHSGDYSYPKKYFDYRMENIKSGGDWSVYSKDRIVIRQIGRVPVVGLCSKGILTSNTLYNIYPKDTSYDIKYLLCILNSSIIRFYRTEKYYDGKALFPKIKGYQLKQLPIPEMSQEKQKPFIENADLMLNLNKEFHDELSQTFSFLSQKFGLKKITTKLEKFWELDFAVLKKELNIGKLSMMEEEDLMKRFENKKKYFEGKLAEIEQVDKSIDEMVFDLYGLTKEERKIVKGN